ncbi:uncharacterized protein K02A2.6-like [Pecten maximus]|uniref:uncharacterized protein K02A2.6-like n=1 Tax=Pecten maximus TaxID=6579 RepID=UPI001458DF74|nr:uncharacterized protein K02A2.6-like [Pecten maximus]
MAQATSYLPELGGVGVFDCSDTAAIGPRWKRWLRAFDLYAGGRGVKDPAQKKSLLLHCSGLSVQDIFFTLTESTEGADVYEKTVSTLNKHFTPEVNIPYERHLFRSMSQKADETVEQFITRLRQKAETCEFGDLNAVNEQIRDQVIEKCSQHHLRRKLLEKGRTLTLVQLREIARALEQSERQARNIEGIEEVNKVAWGAKGAKSRTFSRPRKDNRKSGNTNSHRVIGPCYNCGREGHLAKDDKCPAKGQKCRKCHGVGHFEARCKSKGQKSTVRQVSSEGPANYAFSVHGTSGQTQNSIVINIGGIQTEAIIDSGASCNVMNRGTWETLKRQSIKCTSKKSDKHIFVYGSQTPIHAVGSFVARIAYNDRYEDGVEFLVIEGRGQTLLGKDTSIKLGVLRLGPLPSPNERHDINKVSTTLGIKDELIRKYPKAFQGLGTLRNFELEISLDPEVKPIAQPLRRVPYNLRDRLEKKLLELEDLDIIEPVHGPTSWVSPIVVVPKGDTDIRLCVDMRQANTAVLRERFPIPTVDEVLQDMNCSKVFSKIDIKWAYHQIMLAEKSRDITTFVTHKGLYRYKRLMFGVSCAPEMFQKVVQQVLQGCEGVQNIMDDVIVHGSSQDEHDQRLREAVRVLSESGMTLNSDKCEFNMSKLVFMGHVLSEKGIGPSEVKVKAVLDAREPTTASEVRSFLGLVNYSARFIPDLATISAPLRKLTKKDEEFVWGAEQQVAFNVLKKCLAQAETLGYFDKNAKTQVITDASPVGLGAVLVQESQSGESRVICYASRSLSDTEKRYSQTEKEALAIVWACERFHVYLYGMEFELLTDHKPLECIYSTRSKPCARIERWVLRLQPYRYRVRYIPGSRNIADSLSRFLKVSKVSNSSHEVGEEYIRFVAKEATPVAMTTREVERESEKDPELSEVREHLLNGQWHKTEHTAYLPVRNELSAIGMIVLRGTRLVVPRSLRERVLELAHEGHPGIVSMKHRLRSKVWWPGIDNEVEKFCRKCYGCQLVSQPCKPEPMKRRELPSLPWQHLAADLLGPLPTGDFIFVLVDYYSRWFEVEVTKTTTSEKITQILSKFFLTHGLSESIQTDNGPQFISEHFKVFCSSHGIEHRRTTPLWPQANGQVERENRSIMKRVRIAQAEGRSWKDDLNSYLLMYRSTPHSTTGISPAELLYGRKLRTKLPDLHHYSTDDINTEVRDRDTEKKEKGRAYADAKRGARESEVHEGDLVLRKQDRHDKFSTTFHPEPCQVLKKTGNSVTLDSGHKRNVTHLKKFVENPVQPQEPQKEPVVVPEMEPPVDTGGVVQAELAEEPKGSIPQSVNERPRREHKMPTKFDDYHVYK